MSLLLQIVVFLIIAAALGFAVGWLVRGNRLQVERAGLEGDWQTRLARLTDERDRLRAELSAAGGGGAAAGRQAAADQTKQAARIAELEGELALAREAHARHQAEVGRLEARTAELEARAAKPATVRAVAEPALAQVAGTPPSALARPEGKPDDLQQISGIGPGIERTLHELGIFHFHQIAALTPANVAWINKHLRFKGRIEREDWIEQAKRLAGA